MEALFDRLEGAHWDNVKFKILFLATAAFLICGTSYFYHGSSQQAVTSSGRIMVSSFLFLFLGSDTTETKAPTFEMKTIAVAIVLLASVNAFIAIWQLSNGALGYPELPQYLKSGYFWNIPQREIFRVAGVLNSYQTSAALSFFGLILVNTIFKSWWGTLLSIFLCVPIIFGGRTYIPLILLLLLFLNKKVLVFYAFLVFFIISYYGTSDLGGLESYIKYRIIPVFQVIFTLDFNADYSFADTTNHYRMPDTFLDLLLGNGHDRYSWLGGKDPFFSRWLNQGGVFVASLYVILLVIICLCLISKFRYIGLFLSLAIVASSIKGELATATLVYDTFLFFCAFVQRIPSGRRPSLGFTASPPCQTNMMDEYATHSYAFKRQDIHSL